MLTGGAAELAGSADSKTCTRGGDPVVGSLATPVNLRIVFFAGVSGMLEIAAPVEGLITRRLPSPANTE